MSKGYFKIDASFVEDSFFDVLSMNYLLQSMIKITYAYYVELDGVIADTFYALDFGYDANKA